MEIPFYFYLNAFAILIWLAFHKRFQLNLTPIGYYVAFCFVLESFAWIYSYQTHKSNHWIYNIYTTLQVMALGVIYSSILVSDRIRRVIKIFLMSYPLLVIMNVLFVQSFFKFHTYTYIAGCIFVIILIFSYFNHMLEIEEGMGLRRNPFVWFNLGNMIYFIGSIFYMGSINFILESGHDFYGELINLFVYSFTSIQYCCFIIALLCRLRPAN